jgi:hypothetical protein
MLENKNSKLLHPFLLSLLAVNCFAGTTFQPPSIEPRRSSSKNVVPTHKTTDDAFLTNLLVDLCAEADVQITPLPPTLRLRRRGELTFAFNLDSASARAPAPAGAEFVIGGSDIEPYGVAVWR